MNIENWTGSLKESIAKVADQAFQYFPTVLGALLLLLLGWLIARLLRSFARHLTQLGVNRLAKTRPIGTRIRQSKTYRSLPQIIGRIVFWTILFFFVAASLEALGLPAVSKIIGYISAYLPRVIAGIVIIFAGVWIGEIARVFITRAAASGDLQRTEQLGYFAQILVLVLAVIIALEQLGIDNTILISLAITLLAGIVFAAALSFALGAGTTTANIIAAHYLRREFHVGDRIRINDVEGTITEIGATSVTVETDEEHVIIPANQFNSFISTRIK